jgi:hypothetical protein
MYPNLRNFVPFPKHVSRPFNTYDHVKSHPLVGKALRGGVVERVFRNQLDPRLLVLAIEGGPVSRVQYQEGRA